MEDKLGLVGLLTVFLILAIAFIKYTESNYWFNNEHYQRVAMMQYHSPDGNDLYFPVYKKSR